MGSLAGIAHDKSGAWHPKVEAHRASQILSGRLYLKSDRMFCDMADAWASIAVADCDRLNYIPTGLIDEVRLWDRALSEKEIGQYMEMGVKEALAVNPQAKLSVVWSSVKTEY